MSHIVILNTQRDLPFSTQAMKRAVSFLLQHLKVVTDEVTFHFVSKRKISEVHRLLFDDPTPTDCITLPIDPPKTTPKTTLEYHVLGEVFVCPKVALEYATEHHLDPHQELLRYVIHGLLHLIGYTDDTPQARGRMRRKENSCLRATLCFKEKSTKL